MADNQTVIEGASSQQLAQWLVDFAGHFAFASHRGAFAMNGMTFVFGNDSYDSDPRSKREVELLREALATKEIQELAFATETEGAYTWGMLLEGEHEDWANDNLWPLWEEACLEADG